MSELSDYEEECYRLTTKGKNYHDLWKLTNEALRAMGCTDELCEILNGSTANTLAKATYRSYQSYLPSKYRYKGAGMLPQLVIAGSVVNTSQLIAAAAIAAVAATVTAAAVAAVE